MVMPHWLVFLLTSSTVYNLCSTPQRGQSLVFVARLTLQTLWPVFIGYELPSESSSYWRLLSTELFTTLHPISVGHVKTRRQHPNLQSTPVGSSTSSHLVVRPSRLVTVGERSFASAGPRLWNSLPDDITTAQSPPAFRRKLKTYIFRQSYPDIIL